MAKGLRWLADVAAVLGVALCALAGLVRLAGHFWLGGMDAMTVFIAGMGLMLFACLVLLRLREACR